MLLSPPLLSFRSPAICVKCVDPCRLGLILCTSERSGVPSCSCSSAQHSLRDLGGETAPVQGSRPPPIGLCAAEQSANHHKTGIIYLCCTCRAGLWCFSQGRCRSDSHDKTTGRGHGCYDGLPFTGRAPPDGCAEKNTYEPVVIVCVLLYPSGRAVPSDWREGRTPWTCKQRARWPQATSLHECRHRMNSTHLAGLCMYMTATCFCATPKEQ